MTANAHIRVVGDVHGFITTPRAALSPNPGIQSRGRTYKNLIQKPKYSVQLGDMGYLYRGLEHVDTEQHKVIAGNHEHYPTLTEHFLTGCGTHSFPFKEGQFEFFYVHGAFSVDYQQRILGRDLFEEQEMSWEDLKQLPELWDKTKPRIVMTHECPADIVSMVGDAYWASQGVGPSRTANCLQYCWELWQPEIWLFGHYHKDWIELVNGTRFFCLSELSYMDFDDQGELIQRTPQ